MAQSRIAIVVDSTAQIPVELAEEYGIHVIPQTLVWGTETFKDDVDITPTEFYDRLRDDPVFPTTSQANEREFQELLTSVGADAEEGVLVMVLSGELSGTLNSATQARKLLPEMQIEIVDTRTMAMAMGYVVLAAARAAEKGKSLAECAQLARGMLDKVGILITVDTLEYLHRGGRIGGASKLLGNALNIKAVLTVKDGVVAEAGKVRTRKKAIRHVVDAVSAAVEGKQNIRLAALHAAAPDDAAVMLKMASERVNPVEKHLAELSPVVGAHVGPGTVGLVWCTD
jgi:DegV family protein with EDD domain